ncbi:hypothetical protein NQ315_014111 [Exocentrus adspersus]|uniref:Uncharacterized protein n=1 Tax=Exocentrus adspersus TaxID=1586481 RepID=A0AAV8VV34_9CUCU|nr:hypothetical protein NQ315_014111 [Exocentrus adspersus]
MLIRISSFEIFSWPDTQVKIGKLSSTRGRTPRTPALAPSSVLAEWSTHGYQDYNKVGEDSTLPFLDCPVLDCSRRPDIGPQGLPEADTKTYEVDSHPLILQLQFF